MGNKIIRNKTRKYVTIFAILALNLSAKVTSQYTFNKNGWSFTSHGNAAFFPTPK